MFCFTRRPQGGQRPYKDEHEARESVETGAVAASQGMTLAFGN